jgi:hypothetical protein
MKPAHYDITISHINTIDLHDTTIALFILYFTQNMEYIKGLFLGHQPNPTVQVDSKEHIFRSHHAENGFVSTPLVPKLKKDECTIAKVWKDTVEHNGSKPVFGHRPLIKVSA